MSKKINYSLYVLMVLFIVPLSVQKIGVPPAIFKGLDLLTILSALGILGIALLVKKKSFEFYFNAYDIAYYLFLLAVFISARLNPDIDNMYYLRGFIIYYLVLNLAARNLSEYLTPKLFLTSFTIAYVPLIISHLIYDPSFLRNSAYTGLFYNPNGFGIFMTSITVVSLGLMFSVLVEKKWGKLLIYSVFSLINLYLVMISGSRTAFLAVLLSLFFAFIFYMSGLLKKINNKQRGLLLFLLVLFFLISYFVLKNSYIGRVFQESIVDKFVYQMQKSRLLSGRERIWKYYLKGSYPFKSGVRSVRSALGLSPHNAFIEVISRFGQVAGFFYISSWLLAVKNVFQYAISNLGKDKYLPFYIMAIVAFIGSGMMEIVTYNPLMYVALFANSMVLTKMKQDTKQKKNFTLIEIKNKIVS